MLGVWATCAIIPAMVRALLLATKIPFGDALRGTLGNWPYLLESAHTDLPYFQ